MFQLRGQAPFSNVVIAGKIAEPDNHPLHGCDNTSRSHSFGDQVGFQNSTDTRARIHKDSKNPLRKLLI